jgi:hypothetical protein
MAASKKTEKNRLTYDPPQENVLLLTCMDLRLLDDVVEFMNGDNLCNRYDQLVFAGAALGAIGAPGGTDGHGSPYEVPHWHDAFTEHLAAAVELHKVKDVYILEHRACGAYTKVFHIHDPDDSPAVELDWHAYYAGLLEKDIDDWSRQNNWPLKVHKFLMDLRGDVTLLPDVAKASPLAKKKKKTRQRRSKKA